MSCAESHDASLPAQPGAPPEAAERAGNNAFRRGDLHAWYDSSGVTWHKSRLHDYCILTIKFLCRGSLRETPLREYSGVSHSMSKG
jgi:hypothetical protein